MSIVIKQLSTTDRPIAATFWESCQSDEESSHGPDDGNLDTRLSLIAMNDGEPVGLTLCHREEDGGRQHRLTVATQGGDENLMRRMIDNSLLKLTKRRIHKCQVFLRNGEQPEELLQHAAWVFDDSAVASATAVEVATELDAEAEPETSIEAAD